MNFQKRISVSYSTTCRWVFDIDSILKITTWSKYYPKRGPTLHVIPCRVHKNLCRGFRNTSTLHNLWNCPYWLTKIATDIFNISASVIAEPPLPSAAVTQVPNVCWEDPEQGEWIYMHKLWCVQNFSKWTEYFMKSCGIENPRAKRNKYPKDQRLLYESSEKYARSTTTITSSHNQQS